MKPILGAVVKIGLLLAAVGVTFACGWLTYCEYRFARGTTDLRVMWWSFLVELVFIGAVAGGLVAVFSFTLGLVRKPPAQARESPSPTIPMGCFGWVITLGAAAAICCYLAVAPDVDRQLGGVTPDSGNIIGYWERGGHVVGLEYEHPGSASTGLEAYWFQGLTGVLSAIFTWSLAFISIAFQDSKLSPPEDKRGE